MPQWPIDRLNRGRRCGSGHEQETKHPEGESANGRNRPFHAIENQESQIERPLVLVDTIASRRIVAVVSAEARQFGIREGLTLAEARALCPSLVHAPHEPENDWKALTKLARWMRRFSPIVALPDCREAARQAGFHVFLDVTGCERLFGGLHSLLEQVDEAFRSLRISARLAIAPTPGAAFALAFSGRHGVIVGTDQVREAISPLRPIALRICEHIAQSLHHLGLETIGQVLSLPRQALPARFGPELLQRIDQALGLLPEPLEPVPHHAPICAGMDFDGVVDSLETIWLVFKQLIARVIIELARRECGARKVELRLHRSDGRPIVKEIHLARPTRNAASLFNLMRCATESGIECRMSGSGKLTFAQPALDSHIPAGFTSIRLRVPVFERLAHEQLPLMEQELHDAQAELDCLVERLVLRLGREAVLQARLIESHIPEHACTVVPFAAPARNPQSATGHSSRPLSLLPAPREIGVMVSPSDDRDGRPISFTLDGRPHRVVFATGPERIAGQWWIGHHKTRDYFTVETESGRRLWIFRVRETNRWYWHGEY